MGLLVLPEVRRQSVLLLALPFSTFHEEQSVSPEVLSPVGLLDCPFCGGRPVFENLIIEAAIKCIPCKVSMTRHHNAKVDSGVPAVMDAWNRRPSLRCEQEQG